MTNILTRLRSRFREAIAPLPDEPVEDVYRPTFVSMTVPIQAQDDQKPVKEEPVGEPSSAQADRSDAPRARYLVLTNVEEFEIFDTYEEAYDVLTDEPEVGDTLVRIVASIKPVPVTE